MGAGAEGRQHQRAMRLAGGAAELLAPTGHLRVGVYAGSPTSMVNDTTSHETQGVTYELGKEFADRLNVPVDYVTFPSIADVVTAIKDGKVDFTVTNATPVRAKDIDFSQMLLAVELGYLVPVNSPISRAEDLDRSGIRIGVTKGGTSERVLSEKFKSATIVSAESVTLGIEAVHKGELGVYATNKAILFQMAEQLPGSRVLDGNWGQEHMAVAIPKGRDGGKQLLDAFVHDVQSSGRLEQVEARAGLKGAVKPGKDRPRAPSGMLCLDRRRAVGVEGLDRLQAPGLTLLALGLSPDDRLPVRRQHQPRAGIGDLNAVAAGLINIKEECLLHGVLVRAGLDIDAVLQENIRRAQDFFAAVERIGHVVEAPLGARVIARIGKVVALVGEGEPHARLGAVVEHDLLGGARAEIFLEEQAVRLHISRQSVEMVEPAHIDAAGGKALRLILQ
jgi:polar amino acid transport system substrate-binding protein